MKMIKVSAVMMSIVAAMFLLNSCGEMPGAKKAVSLDTELDSVSYAIGVDIGQNIKGQGFDEINAEAIAKGFEDIFKENETMMTKEDANKYVREYFQKIVKRKADANLKAAEDFLKENGAKDGIVTTESGLQYKVVKNGTGPIPTAEDKVTVTYKGTLLDGTEFDSADSSNPASFPVGGVIKGWTEALQLMPVGSSWILYIHPDLAYGANPRQGSPIGANEMLTFEIELLSIDKK
jgi:FKBP-type peptidyl-prolyl cis-trans isomerase FklB